MKRLFFLLLNSFALNVDLTCSANLALADVPFPCGDVSTFGYPIGFVFAKTGVSITAVGSVPTPAEIVTAMALTTSAKVVVVNPLTGASFAPEQITMQSPYDLAEKINERMTIAGTINYLSDELIDSLRQFFAIHKSVQVWVFDNFGRFYGAKDGFRASVVCGTFPAKENGASSRANIPISVQFYIPTGVTFITAISDDYLDLQNA